jgi:hypothetical protein
MKQSGFWIVWRDGLSSDKHFRETILRRRSDAYGEHAGDHEESSFACARSPDFLMQAGNTHFHAITLVFINRLPRFTKLLGHRRRFSAGSFALQV